MTLCGLLLAVGGRDSDKKSTTAVYMYDQATNSWNVVSHLTIARIRPLVAVLPNYQLMVVGGEVDNIPNLCTDLVEFGSFK